MFPNHAGARPGPWTLKSAGPESFRRWRFPFQQTVTQKACSAAASAPGDPPSPILRLKSDMSPTSSGNYQEMTRRVDRRLWRNSPFATSIRIDVSQPVVVFDAKAQSIHDPAISVENNCKHATSDLVWKRRELANLVEIGAAGFQAPHMCDRVGFRTLRGPPPRSLAARRLPAPRPRSSRS